MLPRSERRPAARRLLWVAVVLTCLGCADSPPPPERPADRARRPLPVPASLVTCDACHAGVIEAFMGHAMADTLGPVVDVPTGTLTHPDTGEQYSFENTDRGLIAVARRRDGGLRRQLVVGRLGAGVQSTSLIGTEIDPIGRLSGRLSFLPVENVRGHGLALAPFAITSPHTGFDQPVTRACLRCHSTASVAALPGAGLSPAGHHVWPGNLLGPDAIASLPPLDCAACHGLTDEHEARMSSTTPATGHGAGIGRLRELPAPAQRDVCARCHLEGAAHLELGETDIGPQASDFLARRPVLVPAAPGDDYRFVSQVERLALSACLQGAPESMTCTSCHDPHSAVAAQGTASFDQRCLHCHADSPLLDPVATLDTPPPRRRAEPVPGGACNRPPTLTASDVTGAPARSSAGCVDCHVRRSQPFDLPHLRSADHFIRRRIPRPEQLAVRHWDDAGGDLVVFDDGRLAPLLQTDAGRRWSQGLTALGLFRMGRDADAARRLEAFPDPGSPTAREPSAPAGLVSLEDNADFHHLRGLILERVDRPQQALAAYGDALALDDGHPEARLNRANLRLEQGDLPGALQDAELLLQRHPRAEKPWNLRARAAALAGDLPAAATALAASTERWGSDVNTWHELGRLLLTIDELEAARGALEQARLLAPAHPGLAADLQRAGND